MTEVPREGTELTQHKAAQAPTTSRSTLDELIPAPMSRNRKILVSVLVIAAAMALSVTIARGYLYPRPLAGVSTSSASGQPMVDEERGLLGIGFTVENRSHRDLRLTDVALDLPDVRFDSVQVWAVGPGRREASSLPLMLPAEGEYRSITIWFEPNTCADAGVVVATVSARFDFGEGSFPPVARTVDLRTYTFDLAQACEELR